MTRYLFYTAAFLLLSLPCATLAEDDPVPEEVARFLENRKIIGSISFPEKSADLTRSSKAKLREIVRQINLNSKKTDLLRIEGWGQTTDDWDKSLALRRTKAVVSFLQEELKVKRAVYFTALVRKKGEGESTSQLDVVMYENTLANEVNAKELLNTFFDD